MIRVLTLIAALLFVDWFMPASANGQTSNWRAQVGTFRVGLIAGDRPLSAVRRARPFATALRQALGMAVEIVPFTDYRALIEAHAGERLEYAIYSASAFSAAWSVCKCVEPVAAPKALDGTMGFNAVLLARKSIKGGLAGLRKKRLLVPGRGSFAGYILPRAELRKDNIILENFGWETRDMKSMDAAVAAFVRGDGDALFGWMPNLKKLPFEAVVSRDEARGTLALLGATAKDTKIAWQSSLIFHGPHVVRKSLPAEAKVILLDFLLNLHGNNLPAYEAIDRVFGGGFAQVSVEDYRPVIDLVAKDVTPLTRPDKKSSDNPAGQAKEP